MNSDKDLPEPQKDKASRDAERIERNKTDPQLTEMKGFTDPDEPLEEEGTYNPLTGGTVKPEDE